MLYREEEVALFTMEQCIIPFICTHTRREQHRHVHVGSPVEARMGMMSLVPMRNRKVRCRAFQSRPAGPTKRSK